jgi:hypothetical protein
MEIDDTQDIFTLEFDADIFKCLVLVTAYLDFLTVIQLF